MNEKKVAIVGGGAAGMMAALYAKEKASDAQVVLFEKNKYLGAKVLISGGGRSNVTTGIFDIPELVKNYPRGAKFLISAFHRFSPQDVIDWFEDHGVPLKIEKDLRVFPVSDKGSDIVGALENEMRKRGVEMRCAAQVTNIVKKEGQFYVQLKTSQEVGFDAVVLACGGSAYRQTGSTGDGYTWAEELGHTITPLGPSLNSFIIIESWISALAGVSIEKAKLTLHSASTGTTYERTGAFVFTHRGLSGPAIFALSSFAAFEEISSQKPLSLSINFFPNLNPEALYAKMHDLINSHPKKKLISFLDMLLPRSLCAHIARSAAVPEDTPISNTNKEQRRALVQCMQNFILTVTGRAAGEEFVTAGGVTLDEVDSRTMQSRICRGLYFAGEILDIDGFTGGFNLQAAWATGRVAGASSCLYNSFP